MVRRISTLIALAIVPATLAGCRQDAPDPVGVQRVQLAIIDGAEHGGRPYSTAMTQEVTSTPAFTGDPDGTGSALITVNLGQREVCWDLSASNIQLPATASHIHNAAAGIRGGIVVFLTAPDASGQATGCRTVENVELLRDILTNPTSYYVNVHTSEFPPGAIRGQLGN